MRTTRPGLASLTLGAGLTLLACAAAGPVPLRWGEESCRHCHMTLADRRFGAEIVTSHGRALAYDDAGCAAEAIAEGEVPAGDVREVFVVDYTHPDQLLAADSATFVRSGHFLTPMGSGVAAAGTAVAAARLASDAHGTLLHWGDVVALAKGGGLRPH